jgi:hypothetical protein
MRTLVVAGIMMLTALAAGASPALANPGFPYGDLDGDNWEQGYVAEIHGDEPCVPQAGLPLCQFEAPVEEYTFTREGSPWAECDGSFAADVSTDGQDLTVDQASFAGTPSQHCDAVTALYAAPDANHMTVCAYTGEGPESVEYWIRQAITLSGLTRVSFARLDVDGSGVASGMEFESAPMYAPPPAAAVTHDGAFVFESVVALSVLWASAGCSWPELQS